MSCLEFENQLLLEAVEEDCLVVCSRGIGIEKLLLQLIKAFNEPDNLVFVIGTSQSEEEYMIKRLQEEKVASNRMPKRITFETSINDRVDVYAHGGILFITSRIFVVDLLKEIVPIADITGLIVYDAHKILDLHTEKFIMRLYRDKNKTGFIKALTQTAGIFPKGFATVDRTMRSLFVKKLYLWPRFRAEITASLEARAQPDVIEVRFSLSPLMEAIQFAIMDLISTCLKELVKSSVHFASETDQLNIESALSPQFGRWIKTKFLPVWNQLPQNARRFIGDINLLREVLFSLTEDDCVTFYNLTEAIILSETKRGVNMSEWVNWPAAATLSVNAKQRLELNNVSPSKKADKADGSEELEFEVNPKWNSFHEIVNEIRTETEKCPNKVNILVIVREESTVKKLKDVLDKGPRLVLSELYYKSKMALNEPISDDDEDPLSHMKKGKKRLRPDANLANLSFGHQLAEFESHEEEFKEKREGFEVHFHTSQDGYLKLETFLRKKKPWFTIVYDPDMESIRRLELYQALYCSPDRAKVYFFVFDGSAEEQRYLTSLRKEKDAFEFLIKEKSTMVVPAERDGKCGNHPDLIRGSELSMFETDKSSRRGGGNVSRSDVINQKIIVDNREFRSELPSLLHKRGIDIDPVTIEIGDYVLTPDMCVERKSISDLIGSINNGRLYNQCSIMTRHYKRSILLIEFEENRAFNFKGKLLYFGYKKGSDTDALAKLVLLTITFPSLRCIWSPSPHFTAEVFEALKIGREQPDMKAVLKVSEEQLPVERNTEKYDLQAKSFLLSLPGISLGNVYRVMNKLRCIADLLKQSEAELSLLLDSDRCGKALHTALHAKLTTSLVNNQLQSEKAVKASKRFKHKK